MNTRQPWLNDIEKAYLLRLARECIAARLRRDAPPPEDPIEHGGRLGQPAGAFVTLHRRGELRGCIGQLFADQSLARVVREQAINAAFHDPRFPPLSPSEFPGIDVEISVLIPGPEPGSPLVPVSGPDDIVIGRDGLFLRMPDGRAGVLLPQVPEEQGWDIAGFLEGICRKTGAGPNAWKQPGARLYRFEAEVFGER
ncbi:MAG TPA: AmmeMemoRadiSam system protein A [Candidatus Hydrogenedentes bacterium]|nr:AmmeMemoRadiSam system protein A [Candidatus Hydrogenedentota bacterium]HOJ68614.1 AmmeMemoRadiSam system protein A [Candidatus Hydrogenedentota bacterium]HOK90675.1 AmmeMemoRadiSam system protein A [Candidatus Hydrogenedentota bacterium]